MVALRRESIVGSQCAMLSVHVRAERQRSWLACRSQVDLFAEFRHLRMPMQLPLDALAQHVGGVGFTVRDEHAARSARRRAQPLQDLVGIGMCRSRAELYDLCAYRDVNAVNSD